MMEESESFSPSLEDLGLLKIIQLYSYFIRECCCRFLCGLLLVHNFTLNPSVCECVFLFHRFRLQVLVVSLVQLPLRLVGYVSNFSFFLLWIISFRENSIKIDVNVNWFLHISGDTK